MIAIAVGKQTNGAVFQLTVKTEALLQSRIPGWSPAPNSLFISYDRPWNFERMHDPMWT